MSNVSNSSRPKKFAVCAPKLPPCNSICPAGEDIQQWISLTKEKKFREAWEVIVKDNPMPAVHGRVCYHYCETRCNRIHHDETVAIHCIERFLGDMALAENWSVPVSTASSGKKVLVVGAGAAGLSAAYYLRLKGHGVTIYEAFPQAGGTMLVGVPEYRLPREVLAKEIARILRTGIKIEYNHRVDDLLAEKDRGGFDAVFLSIGVHLGKNIDFPMQDPCRVADAVDYLRGIAFNNRQEVGNRVVVYGGGNTAIDVARSARRFGVSDVTVVYHRSREKMSAFPKEVEEALEEGVRFIFLRSIIALNNNKLTVSVNELDDKGRIKQTGAVEQIEIDTLIFALSQIPDSNFLRKVPGIELSADGVVIVDDLFMTGHQGVFAGGDMIPYERSITVAVGHGKKAARHIDAYLRDGAASGSSRPKREFICFDKLRISDEKSMKTKQKLVDVDIRLKSFVEVEQGCSQDEVLYETNRCFSCGNCFGCGKCYTACPVKVISYSELDKKVTNIDVDKCIGCGKCFKVCPSGAISMEEVSNC